MSNPSLFRVEHGNPPFLKSEVDFFRPVTTLWIQNNYDWPWAGKTFANLEHILGR